MPNTLIAPLLVETMIFYTQFLFVTTLHTSFSPRTGYYALSPSIKSLKVKVGFSKSPVRLLKTLRDPPTSFSRPAVNAQTLFAK